VAQRTPAVGGWGGFDDAGDGDAGIEQLAAHQQQQRPGPCKHYAARGHGASAFESDLRGAGIEHAGQCPPRNGGCAFHGARGGDHLRCLHLEGLSVLLCGDGEVARHVPHHGA
jgi:hypothetical protein